MDYAKALAVCGAALVGAVAIAAAATPAHAQGPGGLTVVGHPTAFATRIVSYADLNLASGSGRRVLDGRGFGSTFVDSLAFLAVTERLPYSVLTLRFSDRNEAIEAMVTIVRRGFLGLTD